MLKRRRLLRLTRRSAGQYASVLAWQWQDFGGSEVVVFGFGYMWRLFAKFGGALWWWYVCRVDRSVVVAVVRACHVVI
jgi:hypothetical protein